MSSADKPEKRNTASGAQSRAKRADTSPAWAQGLKQLYDSVVEEPLPESFNDLLDAFDERSGSSKDAGTGKTT